MKGITSTFCKKIHLRRAFANLISFGLLMYVRVISLNTHKSPGTFRCRGILSA